MSDFSMPPGITGPKQISSRLLNMKFMQRATATTAQKNPLPPSTPDERRAKRRRTGDFSTTVNNLNSPSTPASQGTPSAGVNGESLQRVSNSFGTPGEETQWILDVRIPNTNGTANGSSAHHDSDYESESPSDSNDEIWSSAAPRGRQTYGSFSKKKQKSANATPASAEKSTKKRSRTDDDGDDEDLSSLPSESDSDDGSEGEIRESQPHKKSSKFDFASQADLRRMDASDLQGHGFERGLGRQRSGLGGGGGGSGRGGGPGKSFDSPASGRSKSKNKKNNKNRKST